MPTCPKCSRPMATVLKREGGMVKTYHDCPYCNDERASKEENQATLDRDPPSGRVPNGQNKQGHPIKGAKA